MKPFKPLTPIAKAPKPKPPSAIGKPLTVATDARKLRPVRGLMHPGDSDALPKMYTPKDH